MLKLQNSCLVRLCEACDRAPAAFLCETDAAALCAACDSDIHTANPLARRHRRVPIPPPAEDAEEGFLSGEEEEEEEGKAASWLLLDSVGNDHVVEEYLDLDDYYNSCLNNQFNDRKSCCGGDSVVPIQDHFTQYNVSPSPAEVAVVPESRNSKVSITTPKAKGAIDSIQMGPTPLTPLEREARVLRYREKKKTRKFVKTIRYASRKTYAETRPRIKGRFAKRKTTDNEDDTVDHMIFSASLIPETRYSIVPTF